MTDESNGSIKSADVASDKQTLSFFKKQKPRILKCLKIAIICTVAIALVSFILIFVVAPLIIMVSPEILRNFLFSYDENPYYSDYNNFTKYGIEGARNVYVIVNATNNITLGVWHLLPTALINKSKARRKYDFESAITYNNFPSILYFHGSDGNRIEPFTTYVVLRKYFHVIAFDYRNYGDSTKGPMTENDLVNDSIQLYKWLQKRTTRIYLWGHSLGSSLSLSTIARLNDEKIIPMGLFLEAPFTNLRESSRYDPLAKIIAWLPWYDATIIDPLEKIGISLKSDEYILQVDCPITIFHAEDDTIVDCRLGKKLHDIAKRHRKSNQGNVTYYQFAYGRQYDHWYISRAPELPYYIEKFIKECTDYKRQRTAIRTFYTQNIYKICCPMSQFVTVFLLEGNSIQLSHSPEGLVVI